MTNPFPSLDEIRRVLKPITMAQIDALSAASGVPPRTIYKIKLGTTFNPGIETVRKFWPHVEAAMAPATPAEA